MSRKVGYATHGIALHLHVRAEHLADQRLQAPEFHNKQLVVRYKRRKKDPYKKGAQDARGSERKKGGKKKDDALFTARLPSAALAARCTSVSWLLSKKRMGSSVSRPTGRTSFSVISANASAALRCRSTLSENDSVVRAVKGEPVKKLVVVRSVEAVSRRAGVCSGARGCSLSRYCRRSATASRSFSSSNGSYDCDLRPWTAPAFSEWADRVERGRTA